MKRTVVLTASDLCGAGIEALMRRPQFRGKHVAAYELLHELDNPSDDLKVRCEVVLFDTEKAARDYAKTEGEKQNAEK